MSRAHDGGPDRGGNCHIGHRGRKVKAYLASMLRGRIINAMARKPEDGKRPKKPADARAARLAAALRENLRRRKAQERQRNTPAPVKGR